MDFGRSAVLHAIPLVFVATLLSAQGERPASQRPASLDDLLSEMRGLRSDIRRTAGVSVRAQIITSRLAILEQRLARVAGDLAALDRDIRSIAEQRSSMERQMTASGNGLVPAREQSAMRGAIEREIAALQEREKNLRQQQAAVSTAAADDEARWADLNGLLDEIDASFDQAPAAP